MDLALWIAQGLLAAGFLMTGALKFATPREKLIAKLKMGWAEGFSASQIKQLGLAEMVGAFGLVVPRLTHIAPRLTPLAALCLALLMMGATATHLSRKESLLPSLTFGLAALFVAVGRSFLYA